MLSIWIYDDRRNENTDQSAKEEQNQGKVKAISASLPFPRLSSSLKNGRAREWKKRKKKGIKERKKNKREMKEKEKEITTIAKKEDL